MKFITVLLIQILCGMEIDLFIPSFPELQHIFSLTPVMVQLTLSVNFAALCVCSLFAGALGDRFNRKHVLLFGLLMFVLGSLCCVFAANFTVLLVGRFLQGMGISAPAILSFPVLLEDYSNQEQAGVMGIINGAKTLAMAVAPVIGSFVNLYFSWRGNFTILLILGLLCLISSVFAIPSKPDNKSISLSLWSYAPLIKSSQFLRLVLGLSLLTSAYWLFMAMAPIFYMESMQVSLKHFGFYQGSLSLTFALVCIMSPLVFKWWGQSRLLASGLVICFLSALLIIAMVFLQVKEPLLITCVLILFSIGVVFPINIIYPALLEIVPHAKGRAAGLGQAILLVMTAVMLETVAYFYQGEFLPIGLAMFVSICCAIILLIVYKIKASVFG